MFRQAHVADIWLHAVVEGVPRLKGIATNTGGEKYTILCQHWITIIISLTYFKAK